MEASGSAAHSPAFSPGVFYWVGVLYVAYLFYLGLYYLVQYIRLWQLGDPTAVSSKLGAWAGESAPGGPRARLLSLDLGC